EMNHWIELVALISDVFSQLFCAHSWANEYEATMPAFVKSAFSGSTSRSQNVPPAPHTYGWILDRFFSGVQIGHVLGNFCSSVRLTRRMSSHVLGGLVIPASLNIVLL